MARVLRRRDLTTRIPIFGAGIRSALKSFVPGLVGIFTSKAGRRFLRAALTKSKRFARDAIIENRAFLEGIVEKSLPLIANVSLEALGSFGTQKQQAGLRKGLVFGSQLLGKTLKGRLKSAIDKLDADRKQMRAMLKAEEKKGGRLHGSRMGLNFTQGRGTGTKRIKGRQVPNTSGLKPQTRTLLENILARTRQGRGRNRIGSGLMEI